MTRVLSSASAATFAMLASLMLTTPASAQFRFDRTVDPSKCRWWQTCDYGGRAYRGHRVWRAYHRPRCPVESTERKMPDGSFVTERRRTCAPLRVRG